jgi:ABC-type bacteriocin/lantibiotic exporter with double-glycine peptidase domain
MVEASVAVTPAPVRRRAGWLRRLAPPFPPGLVARGRIASLAGLALAVGLAETLGVAAMYLLGLALTSGGALPATPLMAPVLRLAAGLRLDPLALLGVGMVAVTLVRALISLEHERRLARLQEDLVEGMADDLLQGYFGMSYERFSARNTADRALQATTELERAGQGAAAWVRCVGLAANLVLMGALLLLLDWRAALLGAAAAVAIGLCVWPLLAWTESLSAIRRPAHAELTVAVAEPLRAYRDLVTSGAWPRFHRQAMGRYRRYLGIQARLGLVQSAIPLALELGIGLVVCAGILLAGRLSPGGATPILVLLVAGAYRFLPALQRLMQSSTLLRANRPSLQRALHDIEETRRHRATPRQGGEPPLGEALVRMDGVHFTYAKGTAVLHGVSFSLGRRARCGIVGPSGSGKSTLVDLLLGLLQPTSGRVAHAVRPDGAPLTIAYLPQQPVFVEGSVWENMTLADRDPPDRGEARRLLDLVGLPGIDLDLALGEGGKGLSGGQRQRLGLARSLYPPPDVLLLDEPTAALDDVAEQEMLRALNTLDCAMVIVTHREAPLALCDQVLRLQDGRLLPESAAWPRTPPLAVPPA